MAQINTIYGTLAQLKTLTNIGDSQFDTELTLALSAASRQIDAHCGRPFWTTDAVTARTFLSDGCDVLDLAAAGGEVSTTTGLIVKTDPDCNGSFDTTLTINTDFIVEPVNAADLLPAKPYTSLRINTASSSAYFPASSYGVPTVQITAKFGWADIPDDVRQACLLQARSLFKAKDTSFSVAGFDSGAPMRVRPLDQIAVGLLAPYVRVEC